MESRDIVYQQVVEKRHPNRPFYPTKDYLIKHGIKRQNTKIFTAVWTDGKDIQVYQITAKLNNF